MRLLFLTWLLLSYTAAYHSPTFWKTFIEASIKLLPVIPIEYTSSYVLKKNSKFFGTFREKPFIWFWIGLVYFFGFWCLDGHFVLSAYWFSLGGPFITNVSNAFDKCKLGWKFLFFALTFLATVVIQNVAWFNVIINLLRIMAIWSILDDIFP